MEVGFIGLGHMGHPMAANLVKAGHKVRVWNRSPEKAKDLIAAGAMQVHTPAEAAGAGVAITMLADDDAVHAVMEGEMGLAVGLPPGGLHVSMSTISYELSQHLTARHAAQGQKFVAAPVLGRPEAAQAAKLSVVAAGPADQIDRAEPLLTALGQRLFRLADDPPKANIVKLCSNFMLLAAVDGMVQAMTLAGKAGVETSAFLEVGLGALFDAPAYRTYSEIIQAERFRPPAFGAPLALKDMRLAGLAAEQLRAPMPFLGVLRDHLLETIALEGDDIDWAGLTLAVRRNAGIHD
jgi:3-hydroxyisobutyrate dehydrogenase-like beta-hydroxyacid dehydrogenase